MGPNTQGPQDHIELEVEKYSLHMPSKVHLEGPSGDHPQAQLPEDLGKHSHPHPGQRVITVQAVPTLEKPFPALYHVTEGTRGALGETSTGRHPKALRGPSGWTGRQATFSGPRIQICEQNSAQ